MVEENEYAGKKSHEILKAVLAKPVAEMEPGTGGSLDHPVEHPFSKWLDEFAKEAMEATTDASEERIIYGKVRALEGLPEAERVIKKLTAGHAADERDIVVLQNRVPEVLDAAIFYAKQVVGSENFRDGMDLGLAQDDDPKKKHEEADIGIVTARTRIEQLENIKAGLQEYMLAAMAERKEPPSRG